MMNLHLKSRALVRLRQVKARSIVYDRGIYRALQGIDAPNPQPFQEPPPGAAYLPADRIGREELARLGQAHDEVLRAMEDNYVPPTLVWPHSSAEWRAWHKRKAEDVIWRKKLFWKGVLRVALLLSSAVAAIVSSCFGQVGALVGLIVPGAVLGFLFYYEKTQGDLASRAAAVQKGVVAGAGEPGAERVAP